jgi:hypothetical protein
MDYTYLNYLVQTQDDLGTDIYKLGRTTEKLDSRRPKRFNSYGLGTIVFCMLNLPDFKKSKIMEKRMKDAFHKHFELDRGAEYFRGDKFKMMTIMLSIYSPLNNNDEISDEEIIDQDDEDADEVKSDDNLVKLNYGHINELLKSFLESYEFSKYYAICHEQLYYDFMSYLKLFHVKSFEQFSYCMFGRLLKKVPKGQYFNMNTNKHISNNSCKYTPGTYSMNDSLKSYLGKFMQSFVFPEYAISIQRIKYEFSVFYKNETSGSELLSINDKSFATELDKYRRLFSVSSYNNYRGKMNDDVSSDTNSEKS